MSSNSSAQPDFTGWRARLWPIHGYELKKFLPLALIMFCFLFNYTLLRDTKDTLVVNSAGAGAISFLKLYCVTPAAILFVIIYAKLTSVMSREKVFYTIVIPFLVFFGAFALVMYPNLDSLHPSQETVAALHAAHPSLSGFIDLYAYWAYSLFYVLAEIWGSAMVSLMFWQFANYCVRMNESKRFYPLFTMLGNVSLIFSGQLVAFCSEGVKKYYETTAEAWQVSLYLLMGSVVALGIVALFAYRWMNTSVLTDKRYFDPEEAAGPKKKKEKVSLSEGLKIVLKSPEVGLIAVLILAYGVTINLVEVQWKNQLKMFCGGDQGAYNAFMGNYSTITGLMVIVFGFGLGTFILQRFSWFIGAVITPLVIAIGGTLFFLFIFAQDLVAPILESFNLSPVTAATFLGAAIVIISKAVKYVLFDPTKEMAYIPLDDELKTKGKAAADVIGGRGGKAGGAFVQSTLQMVLKLPSKDIVAIAVPSFFVFGVVGLLWLFAVRVLAVKVEAAVARRKAINAEAGKA